MAVRAVVFDCRPALLPVSVNLSGMDMRTSQSAICSVESVLVPPEGQFGDVDLAQILAEFVTLPAIVTSIHDPLEMRVMPPAEGRPPKVLAEVFCVICRRGLCFMP